eukprot:Gregarina_sp_Poly_1__9803@NODE_626_length_7076_cov_188_008560_g480_i0_p7_GENE_NODE_626_length_7076_cov_188_008560_g480_i0NODE_626_length_7076_cov_188_008560_g480_i0_p7_ORF_typecomplete_len202_score28_07_NODE_626_length_7076_cov_188_008560_g480_i050635668
MHDALLHRICDSVIPDIYDVNQEDFELDGYTLDSEARDIVLRVTARLLYLVLQNITGQLSNAELQDWQLSLDRVMPGKNGLKKTLQDALRANYTLHTTHTKEAFLSRHFKSVKTLANLSPTLVHPPGAPADPACLPCHIAIDMAEIALCEIMQTISVYANEHEGLDLSHSPKPVIRKDTALSALQDDPDFKVVAEEILQLN